MAGNRNLGNCGELDVLELLAFFANHKPVVLLGNLQVNMGLWWRREREREGGREREREREREGGREGGRGGEIDSEIVVWCVRIDGGG